MLALIGIAAYHSRNIHTQDDYFLASRSMSKWPIALSMYVALFSTNSLIGVIGWLNRPNGTIWIGLQNIGIILSVPFVIRLYPSIFFKLRITTAYEYLEKRFSYGVRGFASILFLASRVMWMSTMLYATSLLVTPMIGWGVRQGEWGGDHWSILLVGVLGVFFALAGGMHAVIWTDVVQFFVLFGGALGMATFAAYNAGGFGKAMETASAAGKFAIPPFFSWTEELSITSGLCLGFFAYLSSAGADQIVLQSYLSAKSDEEAKKSLFRNGMFLKPLSLIFPLIGLLLFVYYQSHPYQASLMKIPDDALPVFVTQVMPAGFRGLIVAAILSAVLTSLSSGFAALSACSQVDFLQRWRHLPLTDAGTVAWARKFTLLWGCSIVGGAYLVKILGQNSSIIQILNLVMYPFSGVLLGIFLLGLLTLRANAAGVLIGATAGFASTISLSVCAAGITVLDTYIITMSRSLREVIVVMGSISSFYYGALGTLVTFFTGYIASHFFKSPSSDTLVGLSHAASTYPHSPKPSIAPPIA